MLTNDTLKCRKGENKHHDTPLSPSYTHISGRNAKFGKHIKFLSHIVLVTPDNRPDLEKNPKYWNRDVCNAFNASMNFNVKYPGWNSSAVKKCGLNSWIFLVFPCIPNAHRWLCDFIFSSNHPEMSPLCSAEKHCGLWLFFPPFKCF